MKVPNREDWEEAWEGLDEACAFKNFFGKTLEQAVSLFEECALVYQEDLVYMPEVPFHFYIFAYTRYLLSEESKGDSDGASCFFGVIELKLASNPRWLIESWAEIEEVLNRLSSGQEYFDACESIYGSFPKKASKLIQKRAAILNP